MLGIQGIEILSAFKYSDHKDNIMKITEKTNFIMSGITIITLIISILGFVWYLSAWKTSTDIAISSCTNRLGKVEQIDCDRDIILLEVKTDLAQIQTDLKWIIQSMGGK